MILFLCVFGIFALCFGVIEVLYRKEAKHDAFYHRKNVLPDELKSECAHAFWLQIDPAESRSIYSSAVSSADEKKEAGACKKQSGGSLAVMVIQLDSLALKQIETIFKTRSSQ